MRTLIGNAYEEERRRELRRKRATELHFPYDKPRKYQDRMIAAVEKALAEGRHLMVSAPSGIGKTAAALYPAVKYALANDMRLFFVTAKNTQQAIAVETLRQDGNALTALPSEGRGRPKERQEPKSRLLTLPRFHAPRSYGRCLSGARADVHQRRVRLPRRVLPASCAISRPSWH